MRVQASPSCKLTCVWQVCITQIRGHSLVFLVMRPARSNLCSDMHTLDYALLQGKTGCLHHWPDAQMQLIDCEIAAGDKFALLDEDEEQLTHLGRSLADDDFKAVCLSRSRTSNSKHAVYRLHFI